MSQQQQQCAAYVGCVVTLVVNPPGQRYLITGVTPARHPALVDMVDVHYRLVGQYHLGERTWTNVPVNVLAESVNSNVELVSFCLPVLASDGMVITLSCLPAWEGMVRALAPALVFGPSYNDLVVYALQNMTLACSRDRFFIAWDFLQAAIHYV